MGWDLSDEDVPTCHCRPVSFQGALAQDTPADHTFPLKSVRRFVLVSLRAVTLCWVVWCDEHRAFEVGKHGRAALAIRMGEMELWAVTGSPVAPPRVGKRARRFLKLRFVVVTGPSLSIPVWAPFSVTPLPGHAGCWRQRAQLCWALTPSCLVPPHRFVSLGTNVREFHQLYATHVDCLQ